jgi:hypothetical protein
MVRRLLAAAALDTAQAALIVTPISAVAPDDRAKAEQRQADTVLT